MKIPKKFASIVSASLMSCIMSAVMSAVSILTISGYSKNFPNEWFESFTRVWPTSFLIIFIVAPFVHWITSKVTEE